MSGHDSKRKTARTRKDTWGTLDKLPITPSEGLAMRGYGSALGLNRSEEGFGQGSSG